MTDSTGVYIGRFQPFHNGHKEAINYLLGKVDFLYIVVGSANKSYEPTNPFTAGERIKMIRNWMMDHDDRNQILESTMILTLPDTDTNANWVTSFYYTLPTMGIIFTHNPLVKALFMEKERVASIPDFSMKQHSGTNVRHQMAIGGDWKRLVPAETAEVIQSISGVERVRSLLET